MQRARTVGLALGFLLAGTLTAGVSAADASWANGQCKQEPPIDHCYAQSEWKMNSSEQVAGMVDEVDTQYTSVPGWKSGDFVTQESWVGLAPNPETYWIETGQISGIWGTGTEYPFMEEWRAGERYYEYIYTTPVSLNTFHNYWTVDPSGNGMWCVYWFEQTYAEALAHGPVHCSWGNPAYSKDLVAGEEAAANIEPASDGADIVSSGWPPPSQPWHPWRFAENYFDPGMCGGPDAYWGAYPGSIEFGAGVGVCGAKAMTANVSPAAQEPSYVAPTGPELSLEGVRVAALKEAELSGVPSPADMTATRSTFAAAQGVMQPGAPITGPSEAWLESSAYLVVMHGNFTAHRSIPRGSRVPKGTVMSLIVDSHTGRVEGTSIGSTTPNPAQLGTVHQLSASSPTAEVASNHGTIVGRVYQEGSRPPIGGKRPRRPPPPPVAVGFPVLVASTPPRGFQITNIVARAVTRKDGSFRISLKPGHYWIAARKKFPGGLTGLLCQSTHVTVRARHRTRVNLVCGKI
jgi:hypothetical protein